MIFRFTLDPNGVPTVVSNPKGWNQAKIRIKRDQVLNGVFVKYITDLIFHSDGFTFLNDLLEADVCNVVEILIERKCSETGDFETLFEGQIFLFDTAEVNVQKCQIKVKVESIDLATTFLRNVDVATRINGFGGVVKSLNDVNINSPNSVAGGLADFFGVALGSVNAWIVEDVFRFIIDYIMDGALTLTSGFLTTGGQKNTWTITIGTPASLGAGDVITTTYDNFYGQTIVVATPFNVDPATTMQDHADDLLYQVAVLDVSKDLGDWDTTTWAEATLIVNVITLVAWVPFSIASTVIAGGSYVGVVTVAETQVYVRGIRAPGFSSQLGNGYGILSGGSNPGEHLLPRISFRQLFDNYNSMYNIGMRIFDNAGVPTIAIEFLEDLFTSGAVITLSRIPDLKYSLSKRNLPSSIILGDRSSTELKTDLNNQISWSTNICGEQVLNLTNEAMVFDNGTLNDMGNGNFEGLNEDLFAVDTIDFLGTGDLQHWEVMVAGVKSTIQLYNTLNQNVNKLEAHLFPLGVDELNRRDFTITNNSSVKLKKAYRFKFPLTVSQLNTILNDPLKPIEFSETGSDHKDGWIDELEYEVQTGMTTFKLLAE